MKKLPIILDIETKYTFRDYDDAKKLGVTVAAIYDYSAGKGRVFTEDELAKLFQALEHASYVVGFNIVSFDLPVLQGYYPGNIGHFSTFDIMNDIKAAVGKRLALNDVVFATLGKRKSGHGLLAIEYYKEGRWEELKKYCMDDVMLTKELFEHGAATGEINYLHQKGKGTIKVNWKKYLESTQGREMSLTLPF